MKEVVEIHLKIRKIHQHHVSMIWIGSLQMILSLVFPLPNTIICDAINQDELQLANFDLKIQPNKADKFVCFLLFLQPFIILYLKNRICPISMKFSTNKSLNDTLKENVIKKKKNCLFVCLFVCLPVCLQTHFASSITYLYFWVPLLLFM